MSPADDPQRDPASAEEVIAARRSSAGLETIVEWLEALAVRARRSWLDRRVRLPLRRPR